LSIAATHLTSSSVINRVLASSSVAAINIQPNAILNNHLNPRIINPSNLSYRYLYAFITLYGELIGANSYGIVTSANDKCGTGCYTITYDSTLVSATMYLPCVVTADQPETSPYAVCTGSPSFTGCTVRCFDPLGGNLDVGFSIISFALGK
jgi:hypothetical protein